jgi:antitoxin CptB
MSQQEDFNRMRWASRRGLLELDLLLAPFVDACYRQLSPELQAQYRELMGCEDQDLLNWIMGRTALTEPRLADIIASIQAHQRSLGAQ